MISAYNRYVYQKHSDWQKGEKNPRELEKEQIQTAREKQELDNQKEQANIVKAEQNEGG